MKWVLVIVVVALGVFWWRGQRKANDGDAAPQQAKPKAKPNTAAGPAQMVRCAHCGLHLPQGDALVQGQGRGQLHFCSQAHALAGPKV